MRRVLAAAGVLGAGIALVFGAALLATQLLSSDPFRWKGEPNHVLVTDPGNGLTGQPPPPGPIGIDAHTDAFGGRPAVAPRQGPALPGPGAISRPNGFVAVPTPEGG